jgi:hypothetical protein
MNDEKINYIPDTMSQFDCDMLTNLNTIKAMEHEYDFIECEGGDVVCCKRGSIKSCDELYVY